MSTTRRFKPGSWTTIALCIGVGLLLGTARSDAPAGSEGGTLLVTSSFGAASALLFVVDTQSRTLAGYEAIPGSDGGLRLLGARKISLDLQLAKYQDLSEWSYRELQEQYQTGAEVLELDRKGG